MSNLEYKIGKVESEFSNEYPPRQKFIVTQEEGSFTYHAMKIQNGCRNHEDIVQAIGRDDSSVLGGGIVAYNEHEAELKLFDKSVQYGGTNKVWMENFREKLFQKYKEFIPELKEIWIDTKD